MDCNEKCKYFDSDMGCTYMFEGNGIPKYAPCFLRDRFGTWIKSRINENMVKCSECKTMFNKSLVYDYAEKELLTFNYCPNCGAKMDLKEVDDEQIY